MLLWEWPGLLISETNQFFPKKAIEILFVVSAGKYWLEDAAPEVELYVDRKMLTTLFNKVNHNWVIDLDSSRQRTFAVFWLNLRELASDCFGGFLGGVVLSSGGAPNYYPNSFAGPEDQPMVKESRMSVSGDVQRFNTANEDNVTQVWCMERLYIAYYIRWVYRMSLENKNHSNMAPLWSIWANLKFSSHGSLEDLHTA